MEPAAAPPPPLTSSSEAATTTSTLPKGKVLPVVKYDAPVLRTKGRAISSEPEETVRQLAADMLETMAAAHGIGLAAQQVGVALQLTVIDISVVDQEERPSGIVVDGEPVDPLAWMPLILLNPRLDPLGEERETASEGCLSFPEVHGDVRRAARVRARGRLLDGRAVDFEATGLLSRALQHEVDHLQGVLFIDRMSRTTRVSLAGRLKRLKRENEE